MNATEHTQPPFAVAWRADVFRITGDMRCGSLLRLVARNRTFRPVFTHRLCAWSRTWPSYVRPAALIVRQAHRWAQQQAGMDLPAEAAIGPGLTIVHGWGLVVSPDARIGANVTLFHGVTLGRRDRFDGDTRLVGGAPGTGDEVWIGPNALVVGPLHIGDGARIGGGAIVTKDVPDRRLVVGGAGRILDEEGPVDCPSPAPLAELRRRWSGAESEAT
jgi:serine O-acetyltransferase